MSILPFQVKKLQKCHHFIIYTENMFLCVFNENRNFNLRSRICRPRHNQVCYINSWVYFKNLSRLITSSSSLLFNFFCYNFWINKIFVYIIYVIPFFSNFRNFIYNYIKCWFVFLYNSFFLVCVYINIPIHSVIIIIV